MPRNGQKQGKGKPDEVYTVEIYRNMRTGIAISEKWTKDGLVHRIDGPAMITRDPETGSIIEEFWMINNQPPREDCPACASRDPLTGRVKRSSWFINGHKGPPSRQPRRGTKADSRDHAGPKGPTG
jgi:hypothetical protein